MIQVRWRGWAVPVVGWLALLGAVAAGPAGAQGSGLVDAINEHRTSQPRCDGRPLALAGPLRPVDALADASARGDVPLPEALRAVGYAASRWMLVTVAGPADAAAAMRALVERHCADLADPQWSEVGVSQQGRRWRVVLAHPVLAADLAPPLAAGRRTLALVNAARAAGRRCGGEAFPPVPLLAWNASLAAAAESHSADMARRDDFAHEGADGSRVAERAARQGYAWRSVGENIAAGQGSPEGVVAGWLASPDHCRNIMSGDFTEMGAAYAVDRASRSTIYWTQVFGRPRDARDRDAAGRSPASDR